MKNLLKLACWFSTVAFTTLAIGQVTVYETVTTNDLRSGVWDVNILADDVHFRSGGIITNVEMSLAINGNQECRLWIFDGLVKDALYSVEFANTHSSYSFDFVKYSFEMRLSVPEDIYIGFSCQGDGWMGSTDPWTDYSENMGVVTNGIAKNAGIYWYGPASGGQLNQGYHAGSGDYFKLRVDMIQPEIIDCAITNGTVSLVVTNVSEYATYLVERSFGMLSNAWDEAGEFTTNASCALWSEELSNDWHNVLYRVRTKPVQ